MNKLKKAAALAIAVVMLLSLGGCSFAGRFSGWLDDLYSRFKSVDPARPASSPSVQAEAETEEKLTNTEYEEPEHGDTAFSDMEYSRPDVSVLFDEIAKIGELAKGTDGEALFDQCDHVDDIYDEISTQYSLAYVLYTLDITDDFYYDEYNYLYEQLNEADRRENEQLMALIDGDWGDECLDEWGQDEIDDIRISSTLNSDEVADLIVRENELSLEYDRISESTTINYNGQDMTVSDIQADDTLDYDTYYALYDEYCQKLSDNIEDMFLELVDVRCEIAETLGFDSFTEYRYLCYDRDYSPEDSQKFWQIAKDYFVPLYTSWYLNSYTEDKYNLYYYTSFELAEIEQKIGNMLTSLDPDLKTSYDYMFKYGLYDFDEYYGKLDGAYTTFFDSYKAPFMSVNYTDDFWSVSSIIHESGHFANYYYNPEDGPLDLAEVDSQGLEMLSMSDYSNFFGEYAGAAASDKLLDMVYSIISGAMQDELQQIIYENPDMTMDDIAEVCGRLNNEYGLTDIYPVSDREWTMINHTFSSPLYYISYGVSATNALDIWRMANDDLEPTVDLYMDLMRRNSEDDYMEVLTEYGLGSPFDEEFMASLANDIDAELRECVSGSWAFGN